MAASSSTDLFKSEATVGETLRGSNFQLSASSGSTSSTAIDVEGAFIQEFSLQYQRQVTRIFELGSRVQHYIEGASQGNFALAQIIGSKGVSDAVMAVISDICNASSNSLSITAGGRACAVTSNSTSGTSASTPFQTGSTSSKITITGVTATSFGVSASAGNFIVNKQLSGMFVRFGLT